MTETETNVIMFIFNKQCFEFFTKLDINNFLNNGCPAFVISKLLGYLIIIGSFGLKIPQIIKIVQAKSGKGLSIIGLVIESFGFLITSAYFYRQGYAVSTYGESPIIFIQNMMIFLLIYNYNANVMVGIIAVIFQCGLFLYSLTNFLPFMVLDKVYQSQLIFILGSRLPQIFQIYRESSTGNLAFITCILNFGGTAARVFTSLQEVNDSTVIMLFATSLLMNGIIVIQFMFPSFGMKKKKKSD